MLCLNRSFMEVKAGVRQLRLDPCKVSHRCERLLAQWHRKRGDRGEKVLALFLPAELNDLIVFGIEHRRQIVRSVVIEIKPSFGVGAPGVFNLQKQMTEQS